MLNRIRRRKKAEKKKEERSTPSSGTDATPSPSGSPTSSSSIDSDLSAQLLPITQMASKLAYEATDKRGNLPQGFTYLKHLSSPETAVWRDIEAGRCIIAFRGTKRRQDIGTDLTAIVMNQHSYHPRYIRSYRQARRVQRTFPRDSIILTGHSLGGHLATTVGEELKKHGHHVQLIHTYNRGSFVWDLGRRRSKKEVEVRNLFDPISLSSRFRRGGKLIEIGYGRIDPLDAHALDSVKL